MNRRGFLAGMAAMASAPAWADVGIRWLTAANTAQNDTVLLGMGPAGEVRLTLPIPSRGHAAAAHPIRAEAVAFARRPGTFALVLDCTEQRERTRLSSPDGRHFYGHGAFTADGAYLLTTENAYDTGEGRIGVWDATTYRRVDELPSGGVGPHEIIRLPDGGFAVANGGIQTHPDNDRARLNLPSMHTRLTWLSPDGQIQGETAAPTEARMNSIRHIDCDAAGTVVAALQWQGNPLEQVPLLARITREDITYLDHPDTRHLKQYAGSIALSQDGSRIAMTGPKGGHVVFFDGHSGAPEGGMALPRVSGAAAEGASGFALTCADGLMHHRPDEARLDPVAGGWIFDNHLVPV